MALNPLDRLPGMALLRTLTGKAPGPRPGSPLAFSPRLLRALGHFRVHPVTFGNRVTLFDRGRVAFNAMLEAIEEAKDHVNLETYILEADATGRRFADALAKKAGQGLVVNLTVDAVGCWHTPGAFFEDLEARGVRVLVFNPVAPWRVHNARWALNSRNHRKILVVDGRTGFTGGLNVGDDYDNDGGAPGRWRDVHVRVEGPAVKYLQKVFMGTRWRLEGDEAAQAGYFPSLDETGDPAVRVLPTNPLFGRPYVRIVLRRAIRAAEISVHATQSYFMPDARVLWSLVMAARRGVDVGLIAPAETDNPLTLHAGRSTFGTLLRSGVEIRERLGTMLHSKTVVVDGEWSIVGSANMDIRSFRINHEISLDVLGRGFAERMEEVYRQDVALSRPVDPAAWANRPFLQKVKEHLCGLVRAFLG